MRHTDITYLLRKGFSFHEIRMHLWETINSSESLDSTPQEVAAAHYNLETLDRIETIIREDWVHPDECPNS